MKTIIVNSKTHGIKEIFIDNEDFEEISKHTWCVFKDKSNFYACTNIERKSVKMHRFLLNPSKNILIDHKDRNGLNNQRLNLRYATSSENQRNKKSSGTSKYLGVHWHTSKVKKKDKIYENKGWLAHIKTESKHIHLGKFKNEEDAAKAYNEAAIKYHGEFANLNIIQN